MILENDFLLLAGVLCILMIIAAIRVVLGKTAPDRVVAVDTVNTLVVAALVLLGSAFGEIIYLDVAIVHAMLAFVTTLFISKYLEDRP